MIRNILVSFTLLTAAVTFAPTHAIAENGCVKEFKAAFAKLSEAGKKIQEAVRAGLTRKGSRARAMKIQEILGDKWKEAQEQARKENGGKDPADPQKVWDDFVKKWEDEIVERMTSRKKGDYPSLDELMAIMAAKSPTFEAQLMDFLWNHGNVKFKVLAQLNEALSGDDLSGLGEAVRKKIAKMGSDGKVTYGKHLWNLWSTTIRISGRAPWTADEFALFMTEMSNAMFRVMNPEPGWQMVWIKAFGRSVIDGRTWRETIKEFSDRFQEDYRARMKKTLEGVSTEAYGRPRPDVVRDFYRFGLMDTIVRRLVAIKTLFTKQGTKIIEWKTGLKIEELDDILGGTFAKYLPRAVKNALIAAKSPEVFREILFNAEVERLSLDVQWFVRPVISGMFLYYTLFLPAYSAYEWNEDRKKFEENVKKDPQKYLGNTKKADDDRLANLEDQITDLTDQKRQIEQELTQNPPLSESEADMRRRALDKINRKIGKIQKLKKDLKQGVTDVHPE